MKLFYDEYYKSNCIILNSDDFFNSMLELFLGTLMPWLIYLTFQLLKTTKNMP